MSWGVAFALGGAAGGAAGSLPDPERGPGQAPGACSPGISWPWPQAPAEAGPHPSEKFDNEQEVGTNTGQSGYEHWPKWLAHDGMCVPWRTRARGWILEQSLGCTTVHSKFSDIPMLALVCSFLEPEHPNWYHSWPH